MTLCANLVLRAALLLSVTIPVSRARAGIAAGRDEMLQRAVQAVVP